VLGFSRACGDGYGLERDRARGGALNRGGCEPRRVGPRPHAVEQRHVRARLGGGRRPRQMGSTHQREEGERKKAGRAEGIGLGELLAGPCARGERRKRKVAGWAMRWRKERPARAGPQRKMGEGKRKREVGRGQLRNEREKEMYSNAFEFEFEI
jgi:hypothetical protein